MHIHIIHMDMTICIYNNWRKVIKNTKVKSKKSILHTKLSMTHNIYFRPRPNMTQIYILDHVQTLKNLRL